MTESTVGVFLKIAHVKGNAWLNLVFIRQPLPAPERCTLPGVGINALMISMPTTGPPPPFQAHSLSLCISQAMMAAFRF